MVNRMQKEGMHDANVIIVFQRLTNKYSKHGEQVQGWTMKFNNGAELSGKKVKIQIYMKMGTQQQKV